MLIKFLLHGKEVNLTSDNIIIKSNNFNVDKDGKMTCSSANITGGSVVLDSSSNNYSFKVFNNTTGVTSQVTPDGVIVTKNSDRGNYQPGSILLEIGTDQTYISANYANFGGKVYGKEFNQTSLESKKKNFKKLEKGLDIVKATDIYKYNLKSEQDNEKKHIGFVIGKDYKYSSEITSVDEKGKETGVELYSMIAVAYKAIQEQQEQIEKLTKTIEKLEKTIRKE